MQSLISIGIGAIFGALLRWKLGESYNHVFPTLPIGTLIANLLGSFLMGMLIFLTTDHSFLSQEVRLGIITGFLGSLTTFSTFSGEALMLFSRQEYLWLFALVGLHVGGSLIMVCMGYLILKFIHQSIGV
ncbi:crcB Protein [Candidatus Protochlamydia naegleriophila]|uniref:Fluoride-specific ion channel FluC n=1 Tax=Candidatus Protochlamydia naegleriophila TaxID=389348 RepID=A0A0U5JDI4_9BACT|nr:fluoride efflux transporter CrcB [Candidatus Protochlamydia naegleriophila]CUI16836.1 crcB Protein [Candidatus Protochlamydia naegleriophila]